jgi:hypothetical protein
MLTTGENNRSSCLSRHKFLLLQQYAYNPAYAISTNFDDNERCQEKTTRLTRTTRRKEYLNLTKTDL